MKKVKINDDTHQALKMYCIVNQTSMQAVADKVITDFLLKEAGAKE